MTAGRLVVALLLFVVAVVVAAVAIVALVGLPVTYEASPAGVQEAELDDAGYTAAGVEKYAMERSTMGVDVSFRNWAAVSHRDDGADADRAASIVVLSTPDARLAGRSLNPLTTSSDAALAATALSRLDRFDDDAMSDAREVDAENRTILGDDVTVRTYATTNETDQGEALRVHVAVVEHRGDMLVLAGVHPEATDERETQLSLMEAIEHPYEAPAAGGVQGIVRTDPSR